MPNIRKTSLRYGISVTNQNEVRIADQLKAWRESTHSGRHYSKDQRAILKASYDKFTYLEGAEKVRLLHVLNGTDGRKMDEEQLGRWFQTKRDNTKRRFRKRRIRMEQETPIDNTDVLISILSENQSGTLYRTVQHSRKSAVLWLCCI